MKKIIGIGIGVLILSVAVYSYAVFKKPTEQTRINSTTVLTMLKSEGFLVTQTFVFNQQVVIAKSSGSEWKDIFWGQTITASANIKINSGVNMARLEQNDIKISPTTIEINLPPIEEESVELLGEIILQNKQGILKKIFDNDTGYNTAYSALKAEAEKAAKQEALQQEARLGAEKQLTRLVQFIAPEKKVQINFK